MVNCEFTKPQIVLINVNFNITLEIVFNIINNPFRKLKSILN